MVLKNCNVEQFYNEIEDNSLVIWGVGGNFKKMLKNYKNYDWGKKVFAVVDNDMDKHKESVLIGGQSFRIEPIKDLINRKKDSMKILITCNYYYEIIKQLNGLNEFDGIECYLYDFMQTLVPDYDLVFEKEAKIPKVIHYCWFGGNPIPKFYKECMETWRKYCPDYKIIRWDEENCDINENLFAYQAYKNGKYGFVPDYFRLKIIYEHGGIYLDTDVELIRNLDDLRCNEAFCGLQLPGEAALGLGFGAVKGNKVIKKLLDRYEDLTFQDEKGRLKEIISPVHQTKDLMELGMNYSNEVQMIRGMTIYPTDVLSPKNFLTNITEITANTYAIHHYDGSWLSGERLSNKKRRLKEAKEIQDMFQ